MVLTPVKAASGRLVRDPVTSARLPTVDDAADPVLVDLDDPHWYRAAGAGDIVEIRVRPTRGTTTAAPADSGKE